MSMKKLIDKLFKDIKDIIDEGEGRYYLKGYFNFFGGIIVLFSFFKFVVLDCVIKKVLSESNFLMALRNMSLLIVFIGLVMLLAWVLFRLSTWNVESEEK